jgi:uncharacterized repeat protein (TIGR03803 family)
VSYKVLFNFGRGSGSGPGLFIAVNSLLYGATSRPGYGTIFVLDTAGLEKALYSFKGGSDGAYPGWLTKQNGLFFGTTWEGGTYDAGTVFSLTTAGKERVLYSFQGGRDGANPEQLLDLNGTLYGATYRGGYNDYGTVFSLTTTGKERVLYRFRSGRDGASPGGLTLQNGLLYGSTSGGGGAGDYGTVFSINTAGKERVLYRFQGFQGGHDGAYPGELTRLNGLLFGTTEEGGSEDVGTVYSVTTAGKERVLYSFGQVDDGAYPEGKLTNLNGVLYGTTSGGGLDRCGSSTSGTPCGTIFGVTTAGNEDVLYRYKGGKNGSLATALIQHDGTLYGTTPAGGQYNQGTVFALTP